MNKKKNNSLYQIAKSTSLLGGSQLITILVSIVRNKTVALLLGSFGIGLISIYQSIIDLIKSVSTVGIETAGVKEIASQQDQNELILTTSTIHKGIKALALVGALICVILSYPIGILAFDTSKFTLQIALLSFAIFFSILTAGEMILLQGKSKVTEITKASIYWNLLSLIIAIPAYYFWRENAIIGVFIAISIITYLVTRSFRNKTDIEIASVSIDLVIKQAKKTLALGIYILASTLLSQITLFIIKSISIQKLGLESLGLVQATWTITNVYISLILATMAADYYPRLSAIIQNNTKVRKLINEQIYFILLVSTPIVIGLLLFSKTILHILYDKSFITAGPLLHWIVIGSFIKIISWTFGFVLISKNKGKSFVIADTLFSILYILTSYLLLAKHNIQAIGIAFTAAYFIYFIIVIIHSKRLVNFAWKSYNIKTLTVGILLIFISFCLIHFDSGKLYYCSWLLFAISTVYSIYKLNEIYPINDIFKKFRNK